MLTTRNNFINIMGYKLGSESSGVLELFSTSFIFVTEIHCCNIMKFFPPFLFRGLFSHYKNYPNVPKPLYLSLNLGFIYGDEVIDSRIQFSQGNCSPYCKAIPTVNIL